jgi:DNA-binding NarL/FixJ family response regulator
MTTAHAFLIVEDETMMRHFIRRTLQESHPEYEIIEASTLAEAMAQEGKMFALAIIDIQLLDGNTLDWIHQWVPKPDSPPVIVLTSHDEDSVLFRSLHSGVRGFVRKADSPELLSEAIQSVLRGGTYHSPAAKQKLVEIRATPDFYGKILSVREQELIKHLGLGLTNEEVAAIVGLKTITVAEHRRNIMRKLGLHTQVELIKYAHAKGFSRI